MSEFYGNVTADSLKWIVSTKCEMYGATPIEHHNQKVRDTSIVYQAYCHKMGVESMEMTWYFGVVEGGEIIYSFYTIVLPPLREDGRPDHVRAYVQQIRQA